jgi:two-component system sensor histidine kinase KdpD
MASALFAPAIATLLGLPMERSAPGSVISLYLLAVVLAAAVGGLWGGVAAAGLSALCFTFFFTAPRYTFRVAHLGDVVDTLVLLAVAIVVGSLVAGALAQRERAAARERDARLLGYLSTKLLSGEPLERVLDGFASALLGPFDLASCEVEATVDGKTVHASATRPGSEPGHKEVVPLSLGGVKLGTLTATRPAGHRPLVGDELQLLEASARQAAMALERARLDGQMRTAQLDLEANQLRAAMFSSVTHDLRSPLASIKAGVTSLLDQQVSHDPDQRRELLTTILEETDRLNRLVGDIMGLAKMRAGALTPARQPTSIEEIVESVCSRLRTQLAPFRVRTVFRPELPDIAADPLLLDQVITNLLENAVAHAPAGSEIQISASPYRSAVQVRVADRGPGVTEDDRERVFEAFYRGDAGPERPGSGLGLAIARAIVTAHGGRIWIEGTPGGGATVAFEIPIDGTAG